MSYSPRKHATRVLLGIDQLVNAMILGSEDETISSRMGKKLITKKDCWLCKVLCGALNWIDPNHCIDAIEHDEGEQI